MKLLHELFINNKRWAQRMESLRPGFFESMAKVQKPKMLWIGCSDSRVPANELLDVHPGHVFVHRNVANVVSSLDLNCLSVLQYAVEVLKVEHVIVCGHYGCGGVKAAMESKQHGLIDNWLRNIKDIYSHNIDRFEKIEDPGEKWNLLCELNVAKQVANVCHTTIVQNAWEANHNLSVHGWIYNIRDGLLRDLDLCISSKEMIPDVYRMEQLGFDLGHMHTQLMEEAEFQAANSKILPPPSFLLDDNTFDYVMQVERATRPAGESGNVVVEHHIHHHHHHDRNIKDESKDDKPNSSSSSSCC